MANDRWIDDDHTSHELIIEIKTFDLKAGFV